MQKSTPLSSKYHLIRRQRVHAGPGPLHTASPVIFQFLLICLALSASAQELDSGVVAEGNMITPDAGPTPSQNGVEIEIGQLIIDNTFSKTGSDFQQIFNTRWTWPMQHGEQFLITVSERPSIFNSTLIEITVNDLKVFESFLQPRYDVVEELATQAIDFTLQYILNYENTVKEIEGDDVSGSGIY